MDFSKLAEGKEINTPPPALYDVESTKLALKQTYLPKIDDMVKQAEAHQVTDTDSEEQAVEMAAQAKRLFKALEAQRAVIINEPDGFVKEVNKFCKPFKVRLEAETQMQSVYNVSQMVHEQLSGYDHLAQDMAAQQAAGQPTRIETIIRGQPKVGRNDPCPCGSGKKYKKCCGKGK